MASRHCRDPDRDLLNEHTPCCQTWQPVLMSCVLFKKNVMKIIMRRLKTTMTTHCICVYLPHLTWWPASACYRCCLAHPCGKVFITFCNKCIVQGNSEIRKYWVRLPVAGKISRSEFMVCIGAENPDIHQILGKNTLTWQPQTCDWHQELNPVCDGGEPVLY